MKPPVVECTRTAAYARSTMRERARRLMRIEGVVATPTKISDSTRATFALCQQQCGQPYNA